MIGYARVSRAQDQDLSLQLRAFEAAGIDRVYEEKASGGVFERPVLHEMLATLQPGDVVVVWKLDRLSRSLADLLRLIDQIGARGAGFRCLTESIDTTSAAGRMMMQMIGVFAEFERSLIVERTQAGLNAARDRGQKLGPKYKFKRHQEDEIVRMVHSGEKTAAQAARLFGINRSTVGRMLKRSGRRLGEPKNPG